MENKYLFSLFLTAILCKTAYFINVNTPLTFDVVRQIDEAYVNKSVISHPLEKPDRRSTMKYIQATLRSMNETMNCTSCPHVYLPICVNESGTLNTYQNRCKFLCLKLTSAKEIRRGICLLW